MVEKVLDFGTGISKVVLSPTPIYPIGLNHFFMSTEDIQIVLENTAWSLARDRVTSKVFGDDGKYFNIFLSRAIFERRGIPVDGQIVYRNRASIDNTFGNLADVSVQVRNKAAPSRGYGVVNNRYTPGVMVNGVQRICRSVNQEDEAARIQCQLDQEFGGYDFLIDRSGDEDLLELVYAGILTEEEAEARYLMRRATAWHVLRYGLEGYFKKHKLPLPKYELDNLGRMVDPKTKKGLCPFLGDN